MNAIRDSVRAFLLEEFLSGEDPGELQDTTPLITGGILDSIATIKLVAFLEKQYSVKFKAHEMSADYLDTIASIADLVQAKIASR